MGREFVDRLIAQSCHPPNVKKTMKPSSQGEDLTFADALKKAYAELADDGLRVSAHAQTRMEERGVKLSDKDWGLVRQAVENASRKGSRDTYVLYGDAGFVVNVPNRTVITAMVAEEARIVTNVDSVVVIPRPDR